MLIEKNTQTLTAIIVIVLTKYNNTPESFSLDLVPSVFPD